MLSLPFFRVVSDAAAAVEAGGRRAGLRLVNVALDPTGKARRDEGRDICVDHLSEDEDEDKQLSLGLCYCS